MRPGPAGVPPSNQGGNSGARPPPAEELPEGEPLSCLAIADFQPGNLEAALRSETSPPRLRVSSRALQGPLGPDTVAWAAGEAADVAVVWTRPEAQIAAFERLLSGEWEAEDPRAGEPGDPGPGETGDPRLARLDREVDAFADRVAELAGAVRWTLVPTWTQPAVRRAFSLLDMKPGAGIDLALMRMNLRLAERLAEVRGVHVLDARKWIESIGPEAASPKLWYMARVPFGAGVFREAASALHGALRALTGRARKLIVLDLDGTLWGGVVGEEGWEGLRLGGHDPVGEAHADFQRALRSFQRRGVILGIVSRNDEARALEAIRRHPEMVLRLEDFAGWRIDWEDKAANLAALVRELDLGLDATVFIDDDPAQRTRVREAFPRVAVPEWPSDPARFREALLGLHLFDAPSLSREDRLRSRMYSARRRRTGSLEAATSVEEWLEGLEMEVRVEALSPANLARAAQLLNRANQMNLATRRLSEDELSAWAEPGEREVWLFRVSDRFGDSGICGLLGLECGDREVRIRDYVLSCRVTGRRIEDLMAAVAVERARDRGLRRVRALYRPTERNGPCLAFWERSGFEREEEGGAFAWDAERPYPPPSSIRVSGGPAALGHAATMP